LCGFVGRHNNSSVKLCEFEYELKMKDLFDLQAVKINRFLKSDFRITKVYFPWHRSFEVGFKIKIGKTTK